MDVTVKDLKDGFYVDPLTKKIFYLLKGQVPPWVLSKPWEWKPIKKGGEKK